jgi:hypothetical protein
VKPKEIKELVAIATDGKAIVGYTENEQKRKKRFLALSLKAVKFLAERLGVKGSASVNPAGPAISGDARFCGEDWEICFSHNFPRRDWGDFFVRRYEKYASIQQTPTVWIRWEELIDFDGLIGRLRRDKRLSDNAEERVLAHTKAERKPVKKKAAR